MTNRDGTPKTKAKKQNSKTFGNKISYADNIDYELISQFSAVTIGKRRISDPDSKTYLKYSLRCNLPFHMVTPFVSALESLGLEENNVGFYRNLSKNILALSLLQAAKQVFCTYSASTRSDLNPYITISKMEFTLPAIVDTLLKAIGNFKTKNGSAKIRFPNVTMKIFLYNASYVLEKYGDDDSIDESKIKPFFTFMKVNR